MKIQLSDHFTYKRLFRFILPSVVTMIFTSVYGIVDGFFVSNYAGKMAFTAVNFAMPVLMILGVVGFMFGTGGSAIVAKTMGEDKPDLACRRFTTVIFASFLLSLVLTALGLLLFEDFMSALGAEGDLLSQSTYYGKMVLLGLPAYTLQYAFQPFFVTAQRPELGLRVTVASGVTNIVLDILLVGQFGLGLGGAAIATVIGQCIGGVLPLIYFLRPNKSALRLIKPTFDIKTILKACTNGSSELMSNIAMSVVSMLYNAQLLKYAGEDGVSAYGVLMYVSMIFVAVFFGYSLGTAPIVSFNYGSGNTDELQSLRHKSIVIIGSTSLVMLVLALGLSTPLARLFVGYDEALFEMTVRGFYIFSFSFLFSGVAIWSSGFFTALNNGLVSALISFLRCLVFQVASVIVLPLFFGLDGIWASIVVAEALSAVVATVFLVKLRKKYGY